MSESADETDEQLTYLLATHIMIFTFYLRTVLTVTIPKLIQMREAPTDYPH